MAKFRVARFWFDVEAASPEDAAERVRELPHTAGWVAPDPSDRYRDHSDRVLAEAVWLLDEWSLVGCDPTGDHLADRSREIGALLRKRMVDTE
jgi:hypothetical protein